MNNKQNQVLTMHARSVLLSWTQIQSSNLFYEMQLIKKPNFRMKMKFFLNFLITFLLSTFCLFNRAEAQGPETISAGSFIVNMGIVPQTINNGLRPYGFVYEMLKNHSGPIKWVINPNKTRDGVDFTYAGVEYRGGAFIVPAEARTPAVNASIASWLSRGVVGVTTTSPITLPVYKTLTYVPRWVLNKGKNGAIAAAFFANAQIPSSAHGGSNENSWLDPSQLDCCVDLFVMPHAEPTWSTHSRLFSWNLECKGGIWLGCAAGSALHNMFNTANPSEQTNFLAEKTGTASGGGPYSQNSLILWGNHDDGSAPFVYDYPADPIMQFMGSLDPAISSGAERIYIPLSPGWRPTTKVGVYDADQPQRISDAIQHRPAILAWGNGFGDNNRGQVMLEANHDINKIEEKKVKIPETARVAAQRAFFNFSLMALGDKAVIPSIVGLPNVNISTPVSQGSPISLSVSVPSPASLSNYSILWSSSCGGSFSSTTGSNVTFTPPNTPGKCQITVVITDGCGRVTFDNRFIDITPCQLTTTSVLKQPCGTTANGGINITANGGVAPYNFSWTRSGGGTGSGAGTNITGLLAGTYTVTITDAQACTKIQTYNLTASPGITITATPTSVLCNGGNTGAINVSVTDGVAPFTYSWTGGITTQNRSGLLAGTYNLTVTDANTCTATGSAIVTEPTIITGTPTVTAATCLGAATGAIALAVSGGVGPYTYLWNDGTATQNRTGLAAGAYTVTITDSRGCTRALSAITVTQPATTINISTTSTAANCGGTNGSITATVSGGTAPYTYNWSGTPTGDGTATITGLAAGTYDLVVTDSRGCTAINSTTLVPQNALVLSSVIITPTCPPGSTVPLGSDGSITLTTTGGTAPFTFSWTTVGGSGLVPTNRNQIGLSDGSYTVVATDANGCTDTKTYILNYANPAPTKPGAITKN